MTSRAGRGKSLDAGLLRSCSRGTAATRFPVAGNPKSLGIGLCWESGNLAELFHPHNSSQTLLRGERLPGFTRFRPDNETPERDSDKARHAPVYSRSQAAERGGLPARALTRPGFSAVTPEYRQNIESGRAGNGVAEGKTEPLRRRAAFAGTCPIR